MILLLLSNHRGVPHGFGWYQLSWAMCLTRQKQSPKADEIISQAKQNKNVLSLTRLSLLVPPTYASDSLLICFFSGLSQMEWNETHAAMTYLSHARSPSSSSSSSSLFLSFSIETILSLFFLIWKYSWTHDPETHLHKHFQDLQ